MDNKIKIAVSSCLLGEAVRYDGTDKYIVTITELLANNYNLVSLCPEMAVGMGVPRPPIQLVEVDGNIRVLGVDDAKFDMTKPLSMYGQSIVQQHPDICGYILKKHSPSCGIENVKVFSADGTFQRKGVGIYASNILQVLPLLPVIDEDGFLDKEKRKNFLQQVKNYSR